MSKKHSFSFKGGQYLSKIGATWFVSYSFHSLHDRAHMNWKKLKTYKFRMSKFNRTNKYHKFWLQQISNMNDDKLNINTMGLKAEQIKQMASILLSS